MKSAVTKFLVAFTLAILPLSGFAQNGSDYFKVHPMPSVPKPYVSGTVALDLGTDGDLDIVYPNRGELTVLENDGTGTFTQRPELRTLDPDIPIDWPRDLAVADFNGDGRDDLFIADHGDEPAGVPFEDWPGGQSHLFLQTEDGRLVDVTAERLPLETSFTHATAVGDVTGNGAPDIYLASYVNIGTSPEARFYINDGMGHFTSEPSRIPESVRQDYPSSELADVDLDGDLDLILGGNPVSARDALLFNDGTGRFTLAPETALPFRFAESEIPEGDWRQSEWATWNVEAADFNADGYPDLAMGTLFDFTSSQHPNSNPDLHTRVQLLLNNQDGTFRDATDRIQQDLAPRPGSGEAWVQFSYPTDLNGDGFPDLVVAVRGGTSHMFYNDGGERFIDRSAFIPPLTDSWSAVLPGDFTGDGAVDIAVPADGDDGSYLAVNVANISADLCKRKSPDRNDEPSTLSRLRVVGNAIVDDDCTPQVLRGVSVIDPYYMKVVYEDGPKEERFRILAQRWKAKIIRVPVHPDFWSNTYLKHYVDSIVEWGNKYGMYIFIGYHAHGNAITGEVEKPDWRNEWPWRGNPYNPDKRLAISALKKMVTRYKDKPWVIYGTFNEPSYITWNRWRPVAEKLVDVIHAVDPRALVTVSGVDWGYDLSGVLSNPVNRDNVVYETHPYPGKGESWKSVVRTLSGKYPVFIGEWGFPERTHGTTKNYGKPLVNFASELGLGWTAWIWHFDWSPEMLISRYSYKPTEFGSLVFRSLRKVLVTSPNGGQKWKTGKRYAIRWNKGNVGTYVKIQLFKKGKHYRWITKKTRNDGKHAWRVPSSITTSAAYKIKITSTKNKKLTDSSDKNFTITK